MKHVIILARKKLRHNARIHRQAAALSQEGYRVTVVALAEEGLPTHEITPYGEIYRVALIWIPAIVTRTYRRVLKALGDFAHRRRGRRQPGFLTFFTRIGGLVVEACRALSRVIRQFLRACNPPVDIGFGLKAAPRALRDRGDIYFSHDSYPLIPAYLLSRIHRARLVYDAVEFDPDRNVSRGPVIRALSYFQHLMERRIIKKVDAVLTVGDSIGGLISTYYGIRQPTVIRNCPEYASAVDSRQILDAGGRSVVVYAGSITRNNGLEQLIEAMQYVDDAVAVIIGPVSELAYDSHLRLLIASLGLADRVHLVEPVERDEVVSYIASADVGVIPIQKNCLNHVHISPNKLYEYIAARLPVATGDFPTVTPIVRGYRIGEIFDETSPTSIAETLTYIIANKAAYEEALEDCARSLCWENEAPKMVEVVRTLDRA
jgi:glycosyltransferase involved in cell wall biosynthesis